MDHIENAKRRKQLRTLGVLLLVLSAIVFSPAIDLTLRYLTARRPVRLGAAMLSIPKWWRFSQGSTRVRIWKPCGTIFCSSSLASVVIEAKGLPEEVWERAATKVLREDYPTHVLATAIPGDSGSVKCIELESALPDGAIVSSCIDTSLGLTATFVGRPSLKPVFYAVLVTAQRSI